MESALVPCEYYADLAIRQLSPDAWNNFLTFHHLCPPTESVNDIRPHLILRRALAENLLHALRKEWVSVVKNFDKILFLVCQIADTMKDSLTTLLPQMETLCLNPSPAAESQLIASLTLWTQSVNNKLMQPALSLLSSKIKESFKECSVVKLPLPALSDVYENEVSLIGGHTVLTHEDSSLAAAAATPTIAKESPVQRKRRSQPESSQETTAYARASIPSNSLAQRETISRMSKGGRWTFGEEASLVDSVNTYGEGRWKAILEGNPLLERFNSMQLKDKWRNLISFAHVKRQPNGTWTFLREPKAFY